jgi:hypothetical protein
LRIRWTGDVERDGAARCFDRELKTQELTSLPFGIDHSNDRRQNIAGRLKLEPEGILNRLSGPGSRENARQELSRARVKLSRLQRANNRQVAHRGFQSKLSLVNAQS